MTGALTITDSGTGLKVDSAGHASVRLDRGSTAYDSNVLFFTAGTLNWRVWMDGDDDYLYIRDEVSADNVMTFKKGGNVGIGVTSPLTKLHTDFGTLTNGDVNELVLQSKADASTYYSNSAITGITFTNWSGGYTAGSLNRAAGIYGYNADTAERYARFMGLSFYTSSLDANASEKMRIDHLGNVGIGTTSPGVNLQVGDGTADDAARVYYSDNAYTEIRGYGMQFSRGASYLRPTTDKNKSLNIGNDGATWSEVRVNTESFTIERDVSTWLKIDSSGNVGIGTTSPFTTGGTAKLTIASASAISWGASNNDMSYFRRIGAGEFQWQTYNSCLLYTSPSPRDRQKSRMPSSA